MKELQEHELDHIEDDVYLLYLYTPFCGTCQLASKMLTVVKEMLPDVAFYHLLVGHTYTFLSLSQEPLYKTNDNFIGYAEKYVINGMRKMIFV